MTDDLRTTIAELEAKANALFATADEMTALATRRGERIISLESSLAEQRRISMRTANERDQYRRDFAAMSDRAAELACKVSELERERSDRQAAIFAWAKEAFSVAEAMSIPQRGLRLLEEAVEAFQACGGERDTADRMVDYVFGRPPGEIGQELGGVGVTVLALAAAAGLSADDEEQREVTRVLSKPIEEFTRRNAAKNAAGFLVAKVKP